VNPKNVGVDKQGANAHDNEQNVRSRVRTLGLSIGLSLFWLGAIWFVLPDFGRYQIRAVPPSDIFVFGGEKAEWPLSIATGQERARLAKKRPADGIYRQASFTLPSKDGVTIIVPRLEGESGLWVNNIPLGTEEPVPLARTTLGPWQTYARIAPIFLGFSPNRFDVLAKDGFGWRGVGPIWYADLVKGPEFVAKLGTHQKFLAEAGFWISLLGILASTIGLFFQADRIIFVAGLVSSLIFWGQGQTFVPDFLAWIVQLGLFIACWTLAVRRTWLFSSFAGCAAMAGVASLAVFAFAPPPTLYLKLAGLSAAGVWPLLGIGLPILALDNLRGLAGDFVAARAKIANQEIIIQNQEADLHAAIRSSAINEERQRFVRDMHDGVGGQLLSLLMQMRSKTIAPDEVEQELQRGLNDLRLMADSLDHVGSDLDLALTAFERRAAQQLAAAGIGLTWLKNGNFNHLAWDGRKILNLYRVLQEALTNCIRHAKANTISFAFDLTAEGHGFNVTITDDGIGMKPHVETGRGLTNIAKRAAAIGSIVSYTSGPDGKGTKISIRSRG
jgi:signal transduction histidine kinase